MQLIEDDFCLTPVLPLNTQTDIEFDGTTAARAPTGSSNVIIPRPAWLRNVASVVTYQRIIWLCVGQFNRRERFLMFEIHNSFWVAATRQFLVNPVILNLIFVLVHLQLDVFANTLKKLNKIANCDTLDPCPGIFGQLMLQYGVMLWDFKRAIELEHASPC
jgi:hypothetical protein